MVDFEGLFACEIFFVLKGVTGIRISFKMRVVDLQHGREGVFFSQMMLMGERSGRPLRLIWGYVRR